MAEAKKLLTPLKTVGSMGKCISSVHNSWKKFRPLNIA